MIEAVPVLSLNVTGVGARHQPVSTAAHLSTRRKVCARRAHRVYDLRAVIRCHRKRMHVTRRDGGDMSSTMEADTLRRTRGNRESNVIPANDRQSSMRYRSS